MKWFLIQLIILLLIAPGAVYPKAPEIDPTNDFKHLGPVENFLFWTPEQQVASYCNIDKIFPTRIIRAGKQPLELPEQKVNLNGVKVFAVGMFLTIREKGSVTNENDNHLSPTPFLLSYPGIEIGRFDFVVEAG